ncbi:hypothetical protein ACFL1G_09130 [Planctomycetota bacterium]
MTQRKAKPKKKQGKIGNKTQTNQEGKQQWKKLQKARSHTDSLIELHKLQGVLIQNIRKNL